MMEFNLYDGTLSKGTIYGYLDSAKVQLLFYRIFKHWQKITLDTRIYYPHVC